VKWPLVQLKDLCSFMTGGTPSTKDTTNYIDGDIPWIVSGDIHRGEIFDASKRITRRGMERSPAKLLPENSILIALNGQGRTRATVAWLRMSGATCNQSIVAIIPSSPSTLDYQYLYTTLRSMYQQLRNLTGDKNRAGLNMGLIGKVQIPLPPLDEQKRIAGILDAADILRAKRREALAKLDDLLQSTFLDMFGDPVTNPKGWETKKVEEVSRLVRGSSPRPKGDPKFYGGTVPRLMVGDISRDGFWVTPKIDSLTEMGASKSRPVPRGTVVMAVSGDVGVVATVQVPCCVHDGFVAFLELDENTFDSRFFMFQFHFLKMTHEKRKAGAIFQNLTTKYIKEIKLPLPPLALQQRFAEIVSSVEEQKAKMRKHLEQLDDLFASLQQRAFRGDL